MIARSAVDEIVVVLDGDILSTNVEEVRNRIFAVLTAQPAVQPCWRTLCLDLSKARMVDSMGLNLLVSVMKHVKTRGGSTRIIITNPSLHRVFRFTRLDQLMEIELSPGQAKKA